MKPWILCHRDYLQLVTIPVNFVDIIILISPQNSTINHMLNWYVNFFWNYNVQYLKDHQATDETEA